MLEGVSAPQRCDRSCSTALPGANSSADDASGDVGGAADFASGGAADATYFWWCCPNGASGGAARMVLLVMPMLLVPAVLPPVSPVALRPEVLGCLIWSVGRAIALSRGQRWRRRRRGDREASAHSDGRRRRGETVIRLSRLAGRPSARLG